MKFTLAWLRDHLDTDATLDEIAAALTRIGLEVEGVTDPAATLAPFRIAEVLTARPHPQADKLQVLEVATGGSEPLQVVCGAPNARAGLKGVFGPPGAYVPGSGITLKVATIRGVESRGMMCSMRELQLSDAHEGIIELPGDAPVGEPFARYAGLDDPAIEVAITPNRQDCMGVAGIARDLAAAGLGALRDRPVPLVPGRFPCPVPIRIEDADGCPAFFGRVVRGVTNGPSPEWLQRRLKAVGLRPISALVDITNYLTFDRGRPLHVYDVGKLAGGLTARRARDGESLLALNGRTYALDPSMTVIADDAHVHDIGGIMGGADSAVDADTRDVFIECAYFTPERVGETGRRLGLSSDARARFERGVDPAFLGAGLELATHMVLDLCGGEPSEALHGGRPPVRDRMVDFDPALVRRLAGVAVDEREQADILARLGFGIDRRHPWSVAVPSWRRDVDGAADLVEEIVRIAGFDRLQSTPLARPAGVARPTLTPEQRTERRVRRGVAARGFQEAVTWSFLGPDEVAAFGEAAWTLDNPISADLAVMRPSLLPGLLAAASRNLARGRTSARLFELGRRYLAAGERPGVGLVMAGERRSRDWREGGSSGFDLFDAKAEALAALDLAGAPVDRLQMLAGGPDWLHPGRSGRVALGSKVLGIFGELHPSVARGFDLVGRVAVAELYLDEVPAGRSRPRSPYQPSPLQPVRRDFAFLVPVDQPAGALLDAIRAADRTLIAEVSLFDLFEGAGVAEGEKSLAVAVLLQPPSQSLTEADLEAVSAKIVAAAAKAVGAKLRG